MLDYAQFRGRQQRLDTVEAAGPLWLQGTPTQLLAAQRQGEPRQWMITLAQVLRGAGQAPWYAPFDGGVFSSVGFAAPVFGLAKLVVDLTWGSGGAAFFSRFDYPIGGACFGLTADTYTLSVSVQTSNGTQPFWTAIEDVPVVGAMQVLGQPADPTPLRWREYPGAAGGGNAQAAWSVKPYARQLRLLIPSVDIDSYSVTWVTQTGSTVWGPVACLPNLDNVLDVPSSAAAVLVDFASDAAATPVFAEWEIGLS